MRGPAYLIVAEQTSQVPEKRQGDLAGLVASSAASHLNQSNPELIRCSRAELDKDSWEGLSPHESAFFVMGFYRAADVGLLNTRELLQLLLHPVASQELRFHICQELNKRSSEWNGLGGGYSSCYILRNACHPYLFIDGRDHELNCLKMVGQLLGIKEISDGLRDWFILLIADLSKQIWIDGHRSEYLKVPAAPWPALLSDKVTRKLVSSRDINKRFVAACFGDLNASQMEVLASDPREEVRFALALLRPCPGPVLEKLSAEKNVLVNKAAIQNRNCPVTTLKSNQGRSPLRNPQLPEEIARKLLTSHSRKKLIEHAVEISCWTPSLLQEVLDSLDKESLRSFLFALEHHDPPLTERIYSPELLTWMALLPGDDNCSISTLKQLAAAHPRTPVVVLEALAKDSSRVVQESVASNRACPTALHQTLRQQGISGNTHAVVSSPEYPVEWLAEHASDPDPDLRAEVSRHPQCPLSVLIQLLDDRQKTTEYGAFNNRTVAEVAATSPALATFRDPASYETAALALLRSTRPSSRARRLALRSPHCPLKLLSRYATSLDWRERHAVASHPNTPTRLLKALIQDANQHVAQAAVNRRREEMSSNP